MKTPNVFFNSKDEWNTQKEILFNKIKVVVYESITREYNCMSFFGLTPNQEIDIGGGLETELTHLSQDSEWSKKIAWDIIVYGIQVFIQGFILTNTWEKIFDELTPDEMSDILFENIKWQLDDEHHSPSILEDIPQFKCNQCSKINNYIGETGLCLDCEEL
jgi:hypothetical protein